MAKTHHRLSASSRNRCIVTQINKGNATIPQLEAEYGLPWETLVASLHDDHYNLKTQPDPRDNDAWRVFNSNLTKFNNLMRKVAENTKAAITRVAAKKQKTVADSPSKSNTSAQASSKVVPQQNSGSKVHTQMPQPIVHRQQNNNAVSTDTKPILPSVYLVETGYLLHTSFDKMLAMAKDNDMFMVPRFCIKELQNIVNNSKDPMIQTKANNVLVRMYAEDVWEKRLAVFEPVESGFITKTPDVANYKARSFGIAEAAMELYISTNVPRRIHVLTNAMEIHHLVTRMVRNEDLENEIFVTRIFSGGK